MFRNFLLTAFRFLARQRLVAAINVTGLSVSITVFILIAIYVAFVLSTDKFHEHAENIYRLERPEIHNTPGPFGPFAKEHFPEVLAFTRMSECPVASGLVSHEQTAMKLENIWMADSAFFRIFSFPLTTSSTAGIFSGPDRVVISETTAAKFFGKENPVGKQLLLDNRFSLQVEGVMKDPPSSSSIQADMIIPIEYIRTIYNDPQWLESFFRWNYNTLLLLAPGTDTEVLTGRINLELYTFLTRQMELPANEKPEFRLTPLREIYFNHYISYDNFRHGSRSNIHVATGIALIILLLAVINFINLTTAQSTLRTTDIGIRKTLGAAKPQLFSQHLTESVVVTYLAAIAALAMVFLSLHHFSSLVRLDLGFDPGRLPVLAAILAGPLLLGILAGTYPAFYMSSFPPLRILSHAGTAGPGGETFRKILIVLQFTTAIALMVFTLHVDRQVGFLNSKDLGFKKENRWVIEASPELKENQASVINGLLEHPGVVSASLHAYPIGMVNEKWSLTIGEQDMSFRVMMADSAYLNTMGIPLLQGRKFRNFEPSDSVYDVILNRMAVETYSIGDPVGLQFSFFGKNRFRVVGVMENFHFESLHKPIEPLMLINRMMPNYLTVSHMPGAGSEVLDEINRLWASYSPNFPLSCHPLDMNLEKLYEEEARLKRISLGFSILAILIACTGMFGLTLFHVGKRTREVGIRKALGATGAGIVGLFAWEFVRWILLSILLAFPLAWWVISRWMDNFITPSGQSWELYVLAGLISVVLALLTVMIRSVRAAGTNPAEVLRYD